MSKHITGHTGLLCLLGSPVAHSVSPEMHNEACDQLGLDYTYLAFDVPEDKMPEAVQGLRTMGARGWNMIQPHLPIRLPCYDFTPVISPAFGIYRATAIQRSVCPQRGLRVQSPNNGSRQNYDDCHPSSSRNPF